MELESVVFLNTLRMMKARLYPDLESYIEEVEKFIKIKKFITPSDIKIEISIMQIFIAKIC